ncbi:hypothetical protein [Kluyvera cryocrescens]|uniref:hypothetical protein n=1 Tax=Kluyvera cryocrescens TaxID=580 RepID=UPI000D9B7245|nr:hypothetical protein [Kluyvera cryocrescens]SQC34259.1 Uncharacterised protein [Kluyvera cryocrescens]
MYIASPVKQIVAPMVVAAEINCNYVDSYTLGKQSSGLNPKAYSSIAPGAVKAYTDSKFIEDVDVTMAGLTREELDAKLGQNKAEVSTVAAEMRKEMADWRASNTEIMMKLQSEISAINVKLDERFEAQKRSSSQLQWMVGIILAIVALIPAFQGVISKDSSSPQPIVIQVPQQQPPK